MTTFLLLVSFLLHMITLTVIYQLVKQIKALKQSNNSDTAVLMETYLEEIKEENRMLEVNLDDNNNKVNNKNTNRQEWNDRMDNEPTDETYIPHTPNLETEVDDTFKTSQQARILQLHDQGLSNEEIASQLHCGRREVELVIKLYPKANNNA